MEAVDVKLHPPQPKKRAAGFGADTPLPVTLNTDDVAFGNTSTWPHYVGCLVGCAVLVKHTGDIHHLYSMGFFGKSTLSHRAPHLGRKPNYKRLGRKRPGKCQDEDDRLLELVSRRKFMRHYQWKQNASENIFTEKSEDIPKLPFPPKTTPVVSRADPSQQNQQQLLKKRKVVQDANDIVSGVMDDTSVKEVALDHIENSIKLEVKENSWECTNKQEAKDFWFGTNTTSASQSEPMSSVNCDPTNTECGNQKSTGVVVHAKSDDCQPNAANCGVGYASDITNSESRSQENISQNLNQELIALPQDTQLSSDICIDSASDTDEENALEPKRKIILHPLCTKEDPDGEILVADDTEESDIDTSMDTQLSWQPVITCDPYKVPEYLQLSLEEAFFLSYGLGCLIVEDEKKHVLNLTEMWQCFQKLLPTFIPRYITYHNLRSKGWVTHSGLTYGSDFTVYKKGPQFYHSSYCVEVHAVLGPTLRDDPCFPTRPHSWPLLAGLNRATETISKEVMICHVVRPSSVDEDAMKCPSCIPKFQVMEVLMRRWVSKHERENAEHIVIP